MLTVRQSLILFACASTVVAVTAEASPRSKAPARIHQGAAPQREQASDTEPNDELNQTVGTVYWSDTGQGLAVVQLSAIPRGFETRLIARDFELNPTAVLEPTRISRNRILGMLIIRGTPSAGDEVIIPGDAYREAFGDLLILND